MSTRDLTGRVAFVSGASRGIGAGIAQRFAARGMKLVLCSRTPPALPDSEDVLSVSLDVRDEAGMNGLIAKAEERFGGIDLFINNAGVLEPIAPIRDVSVEAFAEHLEVNLVGVFVGSRCYVEHLRRVGRGGVLINISSGAASKAYHGCGAYCAAKAGVERLTEVIALEEAEIGLRAHAVAPGVVDTDMQSLIRATPAEKFPETLRFQEKKVDGAFNRAEFVADELAALAFDPTREGSPVVLRLPDEWGET